MGLSGEFEVGPFHNGINGARLLAEAAVDALGHVDVVPVNHTEGRRSRLDYATIESSSPYIEKPRCEMMLVPRGPAAAIFTFLGLDGDGLRWADLAISTELIREILIHLVGWGSLTKIIRTLTSDGVHLLEAGERLAVDLISLIF